MDMIKMKKPNKLIIILLLLMPIVAFGGNKYACGQHQLNIKEKEIEVIWSHVLDNKPKKYRFNYLIIAKKNGVITAYLEPGKIIESVTALIFNTKRNTLTLGYIYDTPREYFNEYRHSWATKENCFKIE